MLTINRFSNVPVYEQIINAVERDIMLGNINENDKLPSVRELAALLNVNPNTIQKAYAELTNRGDIFTVASSGAFVSKSARSSIKAHKAELLEKIREVSYELCYAGVDEETVIKEIRAAFSSSNEKNDVAIGAKSEKKKSPKKAKEEASVIPKKKISNNDIKHLEDKKPVQAPVRKKMGIELL